VVFIVTSAEPSTPCAEPVASPVRVIVRWLDHLSDDVELPERTPERPPENVTNWVKVWAESVSGTLAGSFDCGRVPPILERSMLASITSKYSTPFTVVSVILLDAAAMSLKEAVVMKLAKGCHFRYVESAGSRDSFQR